MDYHRARFIQRSLIAVEFKSQVDERNGDFFANVRTFDVKISA